MPQGTKSELLRAPLLNREFHTLIHLVCESIEIFKHYDPNKIAISVSASRSRGLHGTLAYVVPLRYVGGKATRKGIRGGVPGHYTYVEEKILAENPQALYLMTFLVPKFFKMKPYDRLETIVHELYHLHPTMRGDLRRFPKPHVHHGPTPAAFNKRVRQLCSELRQKSPFLMKHPLLTMPPSQGERFRKKHLPIPKQSFVPNESEIFSKLSPVFLFLFFLGTLLFSFASHAILPVRLISPTMLQGLPRPGSRVVMEGQQGMRFQATKQSPDRRWVYIENSRGGGWVPKERIQIMTQGQVTSSGPSDADFSVDEDIRAFDLSQSSAVAKRSGELFEEPSDVSERFSRIDEGDTLQLLGQSQSGDWYQVRLDVTGEEGWVPARLISVEQFDRVARSPANTLLGGIVFGSDGLGFGGGLAYYRNLVDRGFSGRPRDRLEIGAGVDFHYKSVTSELDFSVAYRTFAWSIGARYLPSVSNGRFYGMVESGLAYFYTTLATELSQEELDEEELGVNTSRIAFYLGAGLGVSINEAFSIYAQTRLMLKSNMILTAGGGVAWRF